MKISRPLVVFDLETTGTWVEKDKIVEIGMIKLLVDGTTESYVKRVNPGIPIPAYISSLINISDSDIKDSPRFRDIAEEVLNFIEKADLGGFNIERFDLPILQREIALSGLKFDWSDRVIYDAQKIFHVNERRDLVAAYRLYCNKDLQNHHSALDDAQATFEILGSQIKKYGKNNEGIEFLKEFKYERAGEFFDEERKFRWWNKKLYPMFGKYAKKYSIGEIAQRDSEYLEWMLRRDFSAKVKVMIEGVLNGQYPVHPD